MHGCLNTHKGKIIGHIIAIFILTSYDQVLEQTVSCEAFCGSSITDFILGHLILPRCNQEAPGLLFW